VKSPQKESLGRYRYDLKLPWGLSKCTTRMRKGIACEICEKYGNDLQALMMVRNLFISCIPSEAIPVILDPDSTISAEAVNRHAKRHGWHGRRIWSFNQTILKQVALQMTLQRYGKAKDVIADTTGDKMIDNVMKLAGVGEKMKVEQTVSMTWEHTLTQAAKNADQDAVFTLPDTDFMATDVELPEEDFAEND